MGAEDEPRHDVDESEVWLMCGHELVCCVERAGFAGTIGVRG